jgi:DNA modification methylase
MPGIINETIEQVPIGDLQPHPRNPRRGDVGAIQASIGHHGFYGTVVAQRSTGRILAGNHRWLAAKAAGLPEVPVAWVDVDDDQAERILLVDNRANDLASYDDGALLELLRELQATDDGLAGTGFDDAAMDALLAEAAGAPSEDEDSAEEDAVDVPQDPVSRTGDVWSLGAHRLACGDSTNADTVAALMQGETANLCFTSPPYGQQREYKTGGVSDWDALMKGVFANLPMADGGQVLVNLGLVHRDGQFIQYWAGWLEWMRSISWRAFGWYVWDQGPGLPGDWAGRLAPSFEFVFHFNKLPRRPNKIIENKYAENATYSENLRALRDRCGRVGGWSAAGQQCQQFRIPDAVIRVMRQKGSIGDGIDHPAVFPVALPEHIILSYSDPGEVVFEPFSGSGTTILAAQKAGRKARAIELAPEYVDVAIIRFQRMFPGVPVTLADGRTFAEVAAERR